MISEFIGGKPLCMECLGLFRVMMNQECWSPLFLFSRNSEYGEDIISPVYIALCNPSAS